MTGAPIVTLAAGDLEARFAPGAGMVGCSLRDRAEELLGLRGGVEDYLARGKTFGIPLLHPWANRLGAWDYEVAGRAVVLDPDTRHVRSEQNGLPIHGTLPASCDWRVAGTGADADGACSRYKAATSSSIGGCPTIRSRTA